MSGRNFPLFLFEKDKNPGLDGVQGLVGRGTFAEVFKYTIKDVHKPMEPSKVAVKVFKNPDPALVKQEMDIINGIKHPNVVKFYGKATIENNGKEEIGLVFQLYKESLSSFLERVKVVDVQECRSIVSQIVEGLHYLGNFGITEKLKKGIMHRDLAPKNILFAENGTVVIADFGLARELSGGSVGGSYGTPKYKAPEMERGKRRRGHRADVFSLGVIVVEMLTREYPETRNKKDPMALEKWVMSKLDRTRVPDWSAFGFIRDCLTFDQYQRPKKDDLPSHAFFTGFEPKQIITTSCYKDLLVLGNIYGWLELIDMSDHSNMEPFQREKAHSGVIASLECNEKHVVCSSMDGTVSLWKRYSSGRVAKVASVKVMEDEWDDEDIGEPLVVWINNRFIICTKWSLDKMASSLIVYYANLDRVRDIPLASPIRFKALAFEDQEKEWFWAGVGHNLILFKEGIRSMVIPIRNELISREIRSIALSEKNLNTIWVGLQAMLAFILFRFT